MATDEPQLERMQQRLRARFLRMKLAARPMPDGHCLLVSLPLGPEPFESVKGPLAIERVLFSTVGANFIKCLRPRCLFGLPLLDIRRCANAKAIEATIRQAWRNRTHELRETGRLLMDLGIDVGAVEGGSVLAFPVPGESPDAQVLMQRVGEAILPSAGPLSGFPLDSSTDRILEVSAHLDSASDLDCIVGERIRELKQRRQQIDLQKRREPRQRGPGSGPPKAPVLATLGDCHRPKILLVGSTIIEDAPLREALTRRGYLTATANGETEALIRLTSMTPDLVISQYGLGRSDGATFVQATRALPGIVRIPVVLIDEILHSSRREAARAVGAAGYLVRPADSEKFVDHLRPVVEEPGDRRFTRYPQRLTARFDGSEMACLATEVGRGGVFVATDPDTDSHAAMNWEIKLPELGRALHFSGEVLYRSASQDSARIGLGLRFCEISADDEALLIRYLSLLESAR